MADKIDGFLVEKVNRHNMDGNVVIEISVSTIKGEFDEEFSEWDSFERQDYLSENFFKDGYLQTQLDALDAADFKVDDYQAMVGLPLIYKGSEKLGIFNSRVSYRESFHYAYHLGLPMMNAYSARMPIEKSMKIGQLWCDSLIQKEILAAFLKFTNPEKKEATAFLDKIG